MPTTNNSPQLWRRFFLGFFTLSSLIFALGFTLGAYKENHLMHTRIEIAIDGSNELISRYALAQFWYADYSGAKTALNQYHAFLNQIKGYGDVYSIAFIEKTTAINYARIAIIEERQGNAELAQQAWQEAERLAQKSNEKDLNRAMLITLANLMP